MSPSIIIWDSFKYLSSGEAHRSAYNNNKYLCANACSPKLVYVREKCMSEDVHLAREELDLERKTDKVVVVEREIYVRLSENAVNICIPTRSRLQLEICQ